MTPHETECNPLSPAEQEFLPEALSRGAHERDWSVHEEEAWQRKRAARAILREWLDETGYKGLMEYPYRGEVAAKLYATWSGHHRAEPFCDTGYTVTGIYGDLEAAMNAHGLSTFDARCMELGKRLVLSAIDHVLSAHEKDAEAVMEDF